MKIVKFKDGTFGVRKFSIWNLDYVFLDLKSENIYWWRAGHRYFKECKGTYEEAKNHIVSYDVGEPV